MFKQKENTIRVVRNFLLGIFCIACLPGCSDKLGEILDSGEDEIVDVIFNIKSPSAPSTYAGITKTDENFIEEIDVLIFKEDGSDELYAYKVKGESLTSTSNDGDVMEFVVTVKKDIKSEYRFVILANASKYVDALGTIGPGGVKENVLERIQSVVNSSWNAESSSDFTPIPMWGQTDTTYPIDENTQIGAISMIRSLARVDVSSRLPETEFIVKEVYVYNWKTRGCVVPNLSSNAWNASQQQVKLPTLPTSTDITAETPLKYLAVDNKVERNIYLHEAAAMEIGKDLEATALVIGGFYKGATDNLSYYRVDFKDKIVSSDPDEELYEYRNLLRNHCYTISITGVQNEGFTDPDTAFVFKKANITVEITTWNMADLSDTDVIGTYQLNVNQSVFQFNSIIQSGILRVTCDHPSGWSVTQTEGNIKAEKTSEDTVLVEATGSGGGTFTITAGNLSKKITVYYS